MNISGIILMNGVLVMMPAGPSLTGDRHWKIIGLPALRYLKPAGLIVTNGQASPTWQLSN